MVNKLKPLSFEILLTGLSCSFQPQTFGEGKRFFIFVPSKNCYYRKPNSFFHLSDIWLKVKHALLTRQTKTRPSKIRNLEEKRTLVKKV